MLAIFHYAEHYARSFYRAARHAVVCAEIGEFVRTHKTADYVCVGNSCAAQLSPMLDLTLSRCSVEESLVESCNIVRVTQIALFKLLTVEKSQNHIRCCTVASYDLIYPVIETLGVVSASEAGRVHS